MLEIIKMSVPIVPKERGNWFNIYSILSWCKNCGFYMILTDTIHRIQKHDEIKRKNLLIAIDNLIAEYLSKEVFSTVTNSKLNVARFTEMHVAHTIIKARCLELEAELSNLRGKSHNDNHNELVNWFSNLEEQ
nr:hypothetical protein [Tanacetum cinerariifolium]